MMSNQAQTTNEIKNRSTLERKIIETKWKLFAAEMAISERVEEIDANYPDPFDRWGWYLGIEVSEQGQFYYAALDELFRLRHQSAHSDPAIAGMLSQNEILKAKQVPLGELARPYTTLRKVGRLLRGSCPYHDERSPSFTVYPATNTCWCFGCQKGGDTIQFIRLVRNCSFPEAVRHLTQL